MRGWLTISGTLMIAACFAQSPPQKENSQHFHIEGTIESMTNGALPRVEVSFRGEGITRTITVDERGFYQIDLPVGTYDMTAEFPPLRPGRQSVLTKYERFFRVSSPSTIELNGVLYGTYSCDGVVGGKDEKEIAELWKDMCGGQDSFPLPSKDGTPLHLDISFVRRTRSHGVLSYNHQSSAVDRPVLATLNLFSLEANSVEYDPETRTLKASGHVRVQNGFSRADQESATFKFEDGNAIQLH